MKLVFIYGPPAAGKLTVGKELAARTGFRLFHNHLSIDCVVPVFEFGSPSFFRLIELIRYEVVAEAAREGQDLVYTFCYAKDLDDAHVAGITERVEKHGGEVCFVHLFCEKDVLKERVTDESRKQYGKANTREMMEHFFRTFDLFSTVPGRETLQIDNTSVPPEDAAQQIIDHYRLRVEKDVGSGL